MRKHTQNIIVLWWPRRIWRRTRYVLQLCFSYFIIIHQLTHDFRFLKCVKKAKVENAAGLSGAATGGVGAGGVSVGSMGMGPMGMVMGMGMGMGTLGIGMGTLGMGMNPMIQQRQMMMQQMMMQQQQMMLSGMGFGVMGMGIQNAQAEQGGEPYMSVQAADPNLDNVGGARITFE